MNNKTKNQEYWEHVQSFNFDTLDVEELNGEQVEFIHAIKALECGDKDIAEAILIDLYTSTEDKEMKDHAASVLFQLLFWASKWQKLSEVGLLTDEAVEVSYRSLASRRSKLKDATYTLSKESFSMPMTLSITGSPIIEVTINGQQKTLWLDTGAMASILSSDTAETCNVVARDNDAITATASTSKEVDTQFAMIDELEIGGLSITNYPAMIMPKEALILKNPKTNQTIKIDGIIGWDMIRNMDVEINYKDKKVTIRKPLDQEGTKRNLFFCGYPIVKVGYENKRTLYFGMDTGAGTTSIGEPLLKKVHFNDIKTKTKTVGGVGGFIEKEVSYLEKLNLQVQDTEVSLENISMGAFEPATFFKLDGVLGSDIAQGGCLRINYQQGVLDLKK